MSTVSISGYLSVLVGNRGEVEVEKVEMARVRINKAVVKFVSVKGVGSLPLGTRGRIWFVS